MPLSDYHCDKCHRGHQLTSPIGKKHKIYEMVVPELGYRSITCVKCGVGITVEAYSKYHESWTCPKCYDSLP